MTENRQNKKAPCKLCLDTLCLTPAGIVRIYLVPAWLAVLVMVAGVILGIVYTKYWLALSIGGLILPLTMADFRLYLFPVVFIATLLGKKVNCPKCEPTGSVFRH